MSAIAYLSIPRPIESEEQIKNLHPDIEKVILAGENSNFCHLLFKDRKTRNAAARQLRRIFMDGEKFIVKYSGVLKDKAVKIRKRRKKARLNRALMQTQVNLTLRQGATEQITEDSSNIILPSNIGNSQLNEHKIAQLLPEYQPFVSKLNKSASKSTSDTKSNAGSSQHNKIQKKSQEIIVIDDDDNDDVGGKINKEDKSNNKKSDIVIKKEPGTENHPTDALPTNHSHVPEQDKKINTEIIQQVANIKKEPTSESVAPNIKAPTNHSHVLEQDKKINKEIIQKVANIKKEPTSESIAPIIKVEDNNNNTHIIPILKSPVHESKNHSKSNKQNEKFKKPRRRGRKRKRHDFVKVEKTGSLSSKTKTEIKYKPVHIKSEVHVP